ncbi:uncharacterized protein LOC120349054 [Nilaparvata lugens]|uniref:uncharacterized protein LOC120349054 n=1 Tax=Nilaparvata lugens TaxID=108931 RepID=UPI00193E4B50|nr:uncharacterized protein LOC120349054 [Nilaparvata lugens]
MQDVYKKMKKFEIPSKPKVNLGEFAERLKYYVLKNRIAETETAENETFGSEVPARYINLSLLAFPDEIPAFNIFKPRDISTLPSAKTLMDASAELKCVQLVTKELEERIKAKAGEGTKSATAGRKTTGKKKTTKKTPEKKTTNEASGASVSIPDETGAEKAEKSCLDQLLKRPSHIKAYRIQPKPVS